MIRTERYKLIFNYFDDGSLEKELSLLKTDPGEETNVYTSHKLTPEIGELEAELKAFIQYGLSCNSDFRTRNPVDHDKIRDEVREGLKALGYLGADDK